MGEHEVEIRVGVSSKVNNLDNLEKQVNEFEQKIVTAGKRLTISTQKMCEDSAKAAVSVVKETSKEYEAKVMALTALETKQAKEILKAKERTARQAWSEIEKSYNDSMKLAKKSAQVFIEQEREISKAKGRTARDAQVQADKIAKAEMKSAKESAKAFVDAEKEIEKATNVRIQQERTAQREKLKVVEATRKAAEATRSAAAAEKSLGDTMLSSLVKYGLITKAIQAVTSALRFGTTESLRFEKSMSLVNTIVQAPRVTLDELSGEVAGLGVELGKMPNEMAMGMYQVASSTNETVDRLQVLKDATKASVAGFTDVNTAVDAGTSVMNAYQMSVGDLPAIYDKMFKTVDKGKVNFSELNQALSSVISSAVSAKVPIDTLMGQFAFLTQRGVKTEQAATALARAYDAMYEKSADFKKIFGIEVFDNGQLRDSTEILTELGAILDDLDPATRIAAMQALGLEERAQKAFSLMADNTSELKGFINDVATSAGQTDKAFEAATDNILTDIDKMKAAFIKDLYEAIMKNKDGINDLIATAKILLEVLIVISKITLPTIDLAFNIGDWAGTASQANKVLRAQSEEFIEFRNSHKAMLNDMEKDRQQDFIAAGANVKEKLAIDTKYYRDVIALYNQSKTNKLNTIRDGNSKEMIEIRKTRDELLKQQTLIKKGTSESNKYIQEQYKKIASTQSDFVSKHKDLFDKINDPMKTALDNGDTQWQDSYEYKLEVVNAFNKQLLEATEKTINEQIRMQNYLIKGTSSGTAGTIGSAKVLKDATNAIKKSDYTTIAAMIQANSFNASNIDTSMMKNPTAYLDMVKNTVSKYGSLMPGMETLQGISKEEILGYLFGQSKDALKNVNATDTAVSTELKGKRTVNLEKDPKKEAKPYDFYGELANFKESMATQKIFADTEDYLKKFVEFLTGSIDNVQTLKNKEGILSEVSGYLANSKSKLDVIDIQNKAKEIIKKESDFLLTSSAKIDDVYSNEFLNSYKTVLENVVEGLEPLGLDSSEYSKKLLEVKAKLDTNEMAKKNKEVLDKYNEDLDSIFKDEADFIQLANELGTDTSTTEFKDEMNKLYDKLIEDANKLITDVDQRTSIIGYFRSKKTPEVVDPYKAKELTPEQQHLNQVMSETISLVGQLGSALSSDLVSAIGSAMSAIQAIQAGQLQGGVLGMLGQASGYLAIATTVVGVLDGITAKGDAKAVEATARAEAEYANQLSVLEEIAENTKEQLNSFEDLRSTLVSTVMKLPTASNIAAGANASQLAYQALNSQRDFGGITTKWSENQDYWDVYKWRNRNRTQAYTFGEDEVGKMLGIDFNTASIEQLKNVYGKINANTFNNPTSGTGENGTNSPLYNMLFGTMGNMFGKQDWKFGEFMGNTSNEFKANLLKYIEMLEKAKEEAEAFERTVKLSTMTGIQVLDAEAEKEKILEQYTAVGITITQDVKDQVEELVQSMGDFSVTIMQDVRSAIIENGGDVATAMSGYVTAMVNNAFTQVVDAMMGQDFETLSQQFGELVNLQIAGEDVTAKRAEIVKSMLEAIRKSDSLIGAKAKETEALIASLRELGATEEELIKLGLVDEAGNQLTELLKEAADIVKEALKAGFEADASIDVFTSTLGEGVYNSVKDALMEAMKASMYAKMAEKIMGAYDFDTMFTGLSVSEMYAKGQEVMKEVMGKLESSGLDFNNTSATSTTDSISNAVGVSVEKETAGANIVYHNYNFNPYYANPVYYGNDATEQSLFGKFETYLKNNKRGY